METLLRNSREGMIGMSCAGVAVAVLMWVFAPASPAEVKEHISLPREGEKVPRRDPQRDEAMGRLQEIREGRALPPAKFASLEAMVSHLEDRDLTRLLEGLEPGEDEYESAAMWLFCALWCERGRRSESLEEGMRALGPMPKLDRQREDPFEAYRKAYGNLEFAWRSFLRGYASHDPRLAFEGYDAAFKGRGEFGADGVSRWVIAGIVGEWAERDPEAAYARIVQLGFDGVTWLAGFYRHVDPALIPRFKENADPARWVGLGGAGIVAGYWAVSNPEAASGWLEPQLRWFNCSREPAIRNFLTAWAGIAPRGLQQWCVGEGKTRMELLGKRPFDELFHRSPLLAAELVEAGWPGAEIGEIERAVERMREGRDKRAKAAKQGQLMCERAPWDDEWPLLEDWTREFEVAAPRLGIPEEKRRELLEKLRGGERQDR